MYHFSVSPPGALIASSARNLIKKVADMRNNAWEVLVRVSYIVCVHVHICTHSLPMCTCVFVCLCVLKLPIFMYFMFMCVHICIYIYVLLVSGIEATASHM